MCQIYDTLGAHSCAERRRALVDSATNVLMLSDVYFPRINGVSTSIRTFCHELAALGHAVTIVAPDYQAAAQAPPEFEVIRLPSRLLAFDPEDRLIKSAALPGAVAVLAKRHWDVIHIRTPFRAHQLGVRLARATGRPTVESYHTYFEEYVTRYLPWLPRALGRFGVRWLSRRLCAHVDHLLVPSRQMADVLDDYGITTPSTVDRRPSSAPACDWRNFAAATARAFASSRASPTTPAGC